MVLHLKDNGLKYIDALKGLQVVLVSYLLQICFTCFDYNYEQSLLARPRPLLAC